MSFSVRWEEDAHREWMRLWVEAADAADSQVVRNAGDLAVASLAHDPYQGRRLSEGLLLIVEQPLNVFYTIDEVNQSVVIHDVIRRGDIP